MTGNEAPIPPEKRCSDHPAATATDGPGPSAETVLDERTRKLERLPPELGYLLLTVGVLGVVLPGPVGTPALVAGGLILWPGAFGRMENWFQRRFPDAHRHGMDQIDRYLSDLERRYPNSTQSRG